MSSNKIFREIIKSTYIQLRIDSTEYFSSVSEFWIFHNFREIDSQC